MVNEIKEIPNILHWDRKIFFNTQKYASHGVLLVRLWFCTRERQRDRQTERQKDRDTERQRDRDTERQEDRVRQKDRETERQTDRERWNHLMKMPYLRDCDAALPGQLLLNLFRGVRVGKVWVEILVENLRRLLAEVPAFPAGVEEPGSKDHDSLAGALLQLNLEQFNRRSSLFIN